MSLGWHFFHIRLVCCDRRRRLVSVVTLQIRCITARRDEVGQGATKGCRKKKEEKEKKKKSYFSVSQFSLPRYLKSFQLSFAHAIADRERKVHFQYKKWTIGCNIARKKNPKKQRP